MEYVPDIGGVGKVHAGADAYNKYVFDKFAVFLLDVSVGGRLGYTP